MINPLRIVGRRERAVIALDDGFQAAPEQSEVRSVIVDAVRLYWSVIVWRNDIDVFWAERLNASEQLAVKAELKDRAGARIDGQLGVGYFVAPWPKGARRINSQQDVWATIPAPTSDCPLNDHLCPRAHRLPRGGD